MGAQQSMDTFTRLVDPYSVLDSAEPAETPAATESSAAPIPPQPCASASASASTSHISLTIDDTDQIEIDPPSPSIAPSPSVEPPTDPGFEHPVDQIMSRIAPPAVVAMLSSPESSASELPVINPRAS